MKKLFLFDIDGTILQLKMGKSKEIFANVFFDIFRKEIDLSVIPNFSGMTDLQILFELGEIAAVPFNLIMDKIDLIWDKLFEHFKIVCNNETLERFEGIRELIAAIDSDPDFELGLLTGNFKENAYLKLSVFGLDSFFSSGAFGSDHRLRTELPVIAIKRVNQIKSSNFFNKENTLIIGDGPRDIDCAKSNEIKVACVATGHHTANELEKLNPDFLFKDFTDFNTVLEKISNF